MVAARARQEGRSDSHYPGLRYYRFSSPAEYRKKQNLMPGIVVVLQGAKTARFATEALTYGESQCLVLASEAICHGTVVQADASSPYLAIHLDLPPDVLVKTVVALSDTQAARPAAPRHSASQRLVLPVDAAILDAFIRLLPLTDEPVDCATLAPLVIEEIIVRLLRSEASAAIRDAAAIRRSAARMLQSMRFIESEFHRALSIEELAAQAAMSPSHYAHCFRQVAGITPMRYLREVRLNKARALLLGGGLRPSEAATAVGFESIEHFTREFRRRFEASPSEYLRRI